MYARVTKVSSLESPVSHAYPPWVVAPSPLSLRARLSSRRCRKTLRRSTTSKSSTRGRISCCFTGPLLACTDMACVQCLPCCPCPLGWLVQEEHGRWCHHVCRLLRRARRLLPHRISGSQVWAQEGGRGTVWHALTRLVRACRCLSWCIVPCLSASLPYLACMLAGDGAQPHVVVCAAWLGQGRLLLHRVIGPGSGSLHQLREDLGCDSIGHVG